MNDDAEFLAAIKAAPDDDAVRLVYADWLDENGRPGGDFLRVDCEIAALDPEGFERLDREIAKMREEGVWDSSPPDFTCSYDWQRARLVAKRRCVIRDLTDEWMAVVSRVPLDEIHARTREIQSWLRRRLAIAEFSTGKLLWETPLTLRSTSGLEPDLPWATDQMRPGDELWEYNTGGDTWANLCGEMGYAIVRGGRVVEFVMAMMN